MLIIEQETMIISVMSGKGGAGKTSVAVNLALCAERDMQFVDCDVEEPDSHLFLSVSFSSSRYVSAKIPVIDEFRCTLCGKCSDFCAYNALAIMGERILVFPELCHSCDGCALLCPEKAITWREKPVGRIERGMAENMLSHHRIDFRRAILSIGEQHSGILIRSLVDMIEGKGLICIDSPPGTSLLGGIVRKSDCALIVAEPTASGRADLERMSRLIDYYDVPAGVVINRSSGKDSRIEEFCQHKRLPVLGRIPHDPEIARLHSQGAPFVLYCEERRKEMAALFSAILSFMSTRNKTKLAKEPSP
jgi:MinD superfamily P-loop ATPase